MEYNWWDDRTVEEYHDENIHPCNGCIDFFDGECVSKGACALRDNTILNKMIQEEKINE